MKPFKADADFDLALTLSYSLHFLFLSALLIKLDATSEDEADQRTFGFLLICIFSVAPLLIVIQNLSFLALSAREWAFAKGQKVKDAEEEDGEAAHDDIEAAQDADQQDVEAAQDVKVTLDAEAATEHDDIETTGGDEFASSTTLISEEKAGEIQLQEDPAIAAMHRSDSKASAGAPLAVTNHPTGPGGLAPSAASRRRATRLPT